MTASARTTIDMTGIKHDNVGYEGSVFDAFYPARDSARGPGWYVFGRNKSKYGTHEDGRGCYVRLCGRPDRPMRRFKAYNGPVNPGWRTKREALAAAEAMNAHYATPAAP